MPPKPLAVLSSSLPPFLLPHCLLSLSRHATRQPSSLLSQPTCRTIAIKSIYNPKIPKSEKRLQRFNRHPSLPLLQAHPRHAALRKKDTLLPRTGALAQKKGMSAIFDPLTGGRTPVTILQLDRVQVVAHKTLDREGYYAVQVGHGWRPSGNVTRPMKGHYASHGVSPKRDLIEFQVLDQVALNRSPVGSLIPASWFQVGQFVDCRANSKGKGFAGGMKRHGFSGQPASHGTSLTHRAMGSAGQSQGGGSRVLPGKKMAGRMGGERKTVQNLRVVRVDEESGLVVVHGKWIIHDLLCTVGFALFASTELTRAINRVRVGTKGVHGPAF